MLQEQLIGRDAQFLQTQEYPNENMSKQVRKYKYKSTKYNCLCSVQNAHTQIDTQNYPKKYEDISTQRKIQEYKVQLPG